MTRCALCGQRREEGMPFRVVPDVSATGVSWRRLKTAAEVAASLECDPGCWRAYTLIKNREAAQPKPKRYGEE